MRLSSGNWAHGAAFVDTRQILISHDSQRRLFEAHGSVRLDDDRRLVEFGLCPELLCIRRGTTRLVEAGSDPYVSWGRWTDGKLHAIGWGTLFPIPYSANQGMHYVIGAPASALPTAGAFRYELLGATRPTLASGAQAPGNFAASVGVAFSPGVARVGIDASIELGGGRFAFSTVGGAGDPSRSTLTTNAAARFGGELPVTAMPGASAPCAGAGCRVRLDGGLFGPGGTRVGFGYTIGAPGATAMPGSPDVINGAAVFSRRP